MLSVVKRGTKAIGSGCVWVRVGLFMLAEFTTTLLAGYILALGITVPPTFLLMRVPSGSFDEVLTGAFLLSYPPC